jgi:tetratricopeptide (TPR) repeat protein
MAPLTYLNFDIEFERTEQGFRIDVRGPDGPRSATFQLPVTTMELENLVLRVGRTRHAMRRIDSPEIEAAKQFGHRLYQALFTPEISAAFRRSAEYAELQHAGLRVRVRHTRTPELANLPWEYLYDQTSNRFLALSIETPLVRYLEIPERIRPLAVTLPLRALAIIANPRGQVELDVEREWTNIQAALGDLTQRGALVLDRLERPTLAALQRRLRQTPYHILHFVGHGDFDQRIQDGVLMLEDSQGDSYRVSGQELGMLLHDQRSLRLVLLNVCEGGRSASDDPFAGVAQSLVQQGIPAVIAMQFEVSDEAAIALAHEFYGAVADGYPVDAALSEARKSVFAQGFRLEWGTPVLYLRAPDGQIFDTSALAEHDQDALGPAAQQQRVADLYTSGLALFYARRWEGAIAVFEELLAIDPTQSDAASKLRQAELEQQLAMTYERGKQAFDAQRWDLAVAALQDVAATNLQYRETAALLQEAQQRMQLAALYEEARARSHAQSWQAVLSIFDQILAIDPTFQDPADLAQSARAALAQGQHQEGLASRYHQALAHMREERWPEALTLLEAIEQLQPAYRETPALIARAREELSLEGTSREGGRASIADRALALPWATSRMAYPSLVLILLGIVFNIAVGHTMAATRILPLYLNTVGTIVVGALLGPWVGLVTGLLSHIIWSLTGVSTGNYLHWFAYVPAAVGLIAGFAGRAGLFARVSPRWLAAVVGAFGTGALIYCALTLLGGPYELGVGPTVFPRPVDLLAEQPLLFVAACALGAAVGFMRLQRVGYVGMAGLLTGIVAAALAAPMAAYLNSGMVLPSYDMVGETFGAMREHFQATVLGNGIISDPLDNFVCFLAAWLILQAAPPRLLRSFPGGAKVVGEARRSRTGQG